MNRSILRLAILVFGLITAFIHLFLGIRDGGAFGILFILNGLGFLALMVGVLRPPSFLAGQETMVHYLLIVFTAITIVAWFVLNRDFSNIIGVGTKIDELLLIGAVWLHLRS